MNIKKISILFLIIIGMFGTVNVFGTTGTINTNQTVFRKEASKSSESYGYLYSGDEVEVIEKSGDWYKIKSGENTGFVYGTLIDVTEEVQPETPAEAPIDTPASTEPIVANEKNTVSEITNVYVIPSLTSTPKATITKGTKVNVQKTLTNWNYITTDTLSGWVRTYCLEEHTTSITPSEPENTTNVENNNIETNPADFKTSSITNGYISVDAANIRKEASIESEIVTTLLQGAAVQITEENDEWYKVKYGDYIGYIKKTLVSSTPVATSRGSTTRTVNTTSIDEVLGMLVYI